MNQETFNIEVAFALADQQKIITLNVPNTTSLEEAVKLSGIQQFFEDHIDLESLQLGIFGKSKPNTDLVKDGDRVEIYRALIADPKASRQKRAQKKVDNKEKVATSETTNKQESH